MAAAAMPELLEDSHDPNSTHLTAADEDSDKDVFASPFIEECEPLLSKTQLSDDKQGSQKPTKGAHEQSKTARLNVPLPIRPLRRSSSDMTLRTKARPHLPSMNSADSRVTAFRIRDENRNSDLSGGTRKPKNNALFDPTLLFPASQRVRRSLRRSASNPGQDTTKSQHRDPTTDSATLAKRLIMQTKHTGMLPVKPERVRRVRTASSPFQWTNPHSPARPGFMWFPVRSNSDPSSIPQIRTYGSSGKNTSLKPCMKQKSKSAATTPPNGPSGGSPNSSEHQKLRRIKTVDFEDSTSRKLLSLPPLKVWTSDFAPAAINYANRSRAGGATHKSKPAKVVSRTPSCPGMTKSKTAEPAVTRTDVHVVAIAPSWSVGDTPDEGGIDPATPTMQIVESNSGCYEVVWDDVPEEPDIRLHRRGSSASQALHAANPESSHGLQRVNTKLTEWSFGKGTPTELFRPQIVVFPDDDGRAPQYDCAVEDDEDFTVIVPPNSERTSAIHSRHHSRPGSVHQSKSDSYDANELESTPEIVNFIDKEDVKHESLVVPDPEAPSSRPGHLIGSHRRIRKPPSLRRLSNIDESDLNFRGHRDSVTLARSRIFNAGSVSPELFMHRDSVSIAKKRMHTRNHAISSVREIPTPKVRASDPSPLTDEVDEASTPLPPKTAAARALKSSNSTSMLLPRPESSHQHIRILE